MKSARINFGQPNTEYKLEINEAGEATSCYNQDTDTEYIGGGGDFSTAEITIINNSAMPTTLHIPNADELTGTPFAPSCMSDVYLSANETATFKGILYKGKLMIPYSPNITASGNVEISSGMIIISGDCTLNVSASA